MENVEKQTIEENIEKIEKGTRSLQTYFDKHKKVISTIGVGAGLYLLGRRKGFSDGYVKGYKKCFKDIVDSTNTKSK